MWLSKAPVGPWSNPVTSVLTKISDSAHIQAMKIMEEEINDDKYWDEPYIWKLDKWVNNEY